VNQKQPNSQIHYDKDIILIRKLNGESRLLDYRHRSKSKNNRNNMSSASSDISSDHEPNTFYENGEFPIKIVITDRNRSMAPPGTPELGDHLNCENCVFCSKGVNWLSETNLEKIDNFTNGADIKLYQKIKSKKLKQVIGNDNYREKHLEF